MLDRDPLQAKAFLVSVSVSFENCPLQPFFEESQKCSVVRCEKENGKRWNHFVENQLCLNENLRILAKLVVVGMTKRELSHRFLQVKSDRQPEFFVSTFSSRLGTACCSVFCLATDNQPIFGSLSILELAN